MLMIRFQRIGRKNDAAFRIVVTEKTRGPKAGKYVALVGTYNPKTKVSSVDGESVKKWIANGAQVSPSLKNFLITKGVLTGKKINVLPKKQPIKNKENEIAAAEQEIPSTESESQPAQTQTSETSEEAQKDEQPSEAVSTQGS